MKKFLPLLIVFFALSAFAVKISMPSSVPEGSSFTLLAEITETNFDEIRVYLDNRTVFTQKMFSASADYSRIASYSYEPGAEKPRISLVFHSLRTGAYTARVELFRNNSRIKSDEFEFDVYSIARTRDVDSLNQEISVLREEIKGIKSKADSFSQKTESIEKTITGLETSIAGFESSLKEISLGKESLETSIELLQEYSSESKASLNKLSQLLSDLNTELAELTSDKEKTDAALIRLSDRMDGFEEQASPIGFFAIGQGIAVGVGILILIIFIAFFVRRKRAGGPLFESDSGESAYEGPSEEEIDGLEETQGKGKWAFEGETVEQAPEKEENEKRFSLGDLIKRN